MKKILVLDGSEALWLLYKKELSGTNCKVITKTYKNKYLQLIDSEKPGLVIMDNMIPVEEQQFMLKKIRKNHKELPIILHSFASGNTAEINDLFLTKSHNLSELKHKTNILLETQEPPAKLRTVAYVC